MGTPHPQGRPARRKGSPYPKADFLPRLVAKSIDFVFASLFAWLVPGVGPLVGMAFLLASDGLPNGQSAGKRLMGVRTVHIPTRESCTFAQSAIRNLPIAVAFAFSLNPVLILVAAPMLAFEMYMAFSDPHGVRIGDIFADTQVVDGKIPLDAVTPIEPNLRRPTHVLPGREMGEAAEAQSRSRS